MTYEKLSKVFYKNGAEGHRVEYEKRTTGYASYVTSLPVQAFRKGKRMKESHPLFYVHTHELVTIHNRVMRNSAAIIRLISELPAVVVEPYFHKLIINEAQSNNEIEGVRSTKKELRDVLQDVISSAPKRKRFNGLMKTYLFLNEVKPFTELEDFRALYDALVSDEVGQEDTPDGRLFRKGYVEINDGMETTHVGMTGEETIMGALTELIEFLEDERHPELYRYMAAHYYYEYIHPFYDGNGRTGRLLVGSYLARYLDRYSAITFSYSVNRNKSKYYKALEEIPAPLNKGELTFYLIDMLQLLAEGQEAIIGDLDLNLMKLNRIHRFMNEQEWNGLEHAAEVLEGMLYLHVFAEHREGLSVMRLSDLTGHSRYKVEQAISTLEQQQYIELHTQRPKRYRLGDSFLTELLGE